MLLLTHMLNSTINIVVRPLLLGRTEQRYEKFHRSPGIPQNAFSLHF
jgi:hypothetical protein